MGPLPYVPSPFPGELLSSWLRRIAVEYGVELQHLAKHVGLSVSRADDIDGAPSADDLCKIAVTLNAHPTEIREMVHPRQVRVRRATTLLQICRRCQERHRAATRLPVAIRAWFEFWRIECQHCELPFSPAGTANLARCNPVREHPAWFESLRPTARAGARLLAKFVRRPVRGRDLADNRSAPLVNAVRRGSPPKPRPDRWICHTTARGTVRSRIVRASGRRPDPRALDRPKARPPGDRKSNSPRRNGELPP